MPLTISFDLVATGYLRCTVRPARRNFVFLSSYDSDFLQDLVLAALSTLREYRSLCFASRSSQTEWLWIFERESIDETTIEIAEVILISIDSGFGTKSIAKFACKDIIFAKAVYSAATDILAKHGIRKFNGMWPDHPFPKELVNLLGKAIASVENDA